MQTVPGAPGPEGDAAAAAPTPPAAAGQGSPLRRALIGALAVFLVLRVALSVVALVAVGLLPHAPGSEDVPGAISVPGREGPPITPGWHNLWSSWERWDALWYLRIADSGYDAGDGSAAFFPLYPMLVRLATPLVGGHTLAAGLLVSNLAAYGALAALHLVVAREHGEATARRATLFLAAFPTSYFLLAPYSESLFLLLSIVALGCARAGRWPWAGAAAALAATTRSLGILIALPLAIEAALQARKAGGWPRLAATLPWAAAAPLGTASYLFFWWRKAGDPWLPVHRQDLWLREPAWPWQTLWDGTREAARWIGTYAGGYPQLDWLVVAMALAGTVWLVRRGAPSWSAYTVASVLVPLSFEWPSRPLMSVPRFLVVLFPLAWAAAAATEGRPRLGDALLAFSAGLLAVMTLLFVNWYWVF